MSEIIKLEDVGISIGNKKIFQVNFSIQSGDFFLVKGSNAAGKSLLLKLLYLKILPSTGRIFVSGKRIDSNQKKTILEFRKKLGVILQNDFLIPFFSVYQNIQLASHIQKKKDFFDKRIIEILDWLQLTAIKDEYIHKLSNGQKQRVVIARAMINNPKIIIADQPENYLDEDAAKKLFFLFESLNSLGVTIIMATNNEKTLGLNCKFVNL
ncbi:MAG: cell division ATP-binding protein FtsE [Rickettsiales bacterium]|nr:cell division ATP-binding protein FtsE [Rickettsiales bacterium]|tara:strand:+ start:135 stop:764 length:630 start_codon:yes stop_codon:yes gene_type:complete